MEISRFSEQSAGRIVRSSRGYVAFVPDPLPPKLSWSAAEINRLSRTDRALGELAGIGRTLPNPHLLILPFARREAVLSSRIEGTQASLSDLYAYEASPNPAERGDVREVSNYVRALEFGLSRVREFPLSLRLIRDIHAKLMAGIRGEHSTPGEFRRSQNWIGPQGCLLNEATYVPPPAADMHRCLNAFERFLHAQPEIPPLVRLALIHYQFEAIHPFLDGNGRMGRLITILLLCVWDLLPQPLLYLSAYFEARRQTYFDLLLLVSQQGAWKEWIAFFLEGVETQARDAIHRSYRIQELRSAYRARFQSTQASARILQVVDLLFASPVITVNRVKESLNVSFPSANRYIKQLEDEDIVQEITGHTRNRLYRADEILRAIDGFL